MLLRNATDYNRLGAVALTMDDDGDVRDSTSNLEADADAVAGVDLFSLVSSKGGAQLTITAGRWISFQHKVVSTLVTIRVSPRLLLYFLR